MNKERLTKLADYIEKLPKERLYMPLFYFSDPDTDPPCGTVACALGHAALMPEFNAEGLHYSRKQQSIMYKDDTSFVAAAKFFDLSYDDACVLFSPWSGIDQDNPWRGEAHEKPDEVARHIRMIVNGELSLPLCSIETEE